MTEEFVVQHAKNESRFVIHTEHGEAELTYRLVDGVITFTHTGVPKELGGKGIGGMLASTGLLYARTEGLRVVPRCPYVRRYIEKHPEHQDLVG